MPFVSTGGTGHAAPSLGGAGGAERKVRALARSAHLASQNTNLGPLVEGPAITLAGRHTKVRREGYPK